MPTPGNSLNIKETGFQSFDGVSVFKGRTITAGTGITVSNGTGVTGDPIISLAGGGTAIDSVGVQTGTSPIVPTAAGLITINGAVVAAGTNPVRTDGTGANTLAVEVQTSQALGAADATKIGLANFDSASFAVAATGFVTLSTTGVLKTLTGNSGGAISPTANNINTVGSGSIAITGSGSTLTTAITGTQGSVLVGAGASNAAFTNTIANTVAGDFVLNLSNTNSAGNANCIYTTNVLNDSAGDPYYQCIVTSAQTWSFGIDNSVTGNPYVLAASTALGTTNVMSAATTGEINYPLQSCFLAYNSAQDDNVTGDGTAYTIICDTAVYDQNSDYNTGTGTFTAPVTGRYHFTGNVTLLQNTATDNRFKFVASNRRFDALTAGIFPATGGVSTYSGATYMDMDAADVCNITVTCNGTTKTVDVYGEATNLTTSFGGKLVA